MPPSQRGALRQKGAGPMEGAEAEVGGCPGLEVHRQHPGVRRKRTPSIGELRWDSRPWGCSPARGHPGTELSHQAPPGGARRFPGAARPGLTSCSPHLLNHSLISMWGHQGDEDQATLFSGLEAIGGAGIRIFLGRPRSPTLRPAPLSRPLWSVTYLLFS